jgi:mRNA interferase MazF
MKRSEIYWARLDSVEGSEMNKPRPCVIVSRDELSAVLPIVVVCPVTSVLRPKWRMRLQVRCDGRKADICAEQIRTIGKARLGDWLGELSKIESVVLRELLSETYGVP